jgi:hypothetical protein
LPPSTIQLTCQQFCSPATPTSLSSYTGTDGGQEFTCGQAHAGCSRLEGNLAVAVEMETVVLVKAGVVGIAVVVMVVRECCVAVAASAAVMEVNRPGCNASSHCTSFGSAQAAHPKRPHVLISSPMSRRVLLLFITPHTTQVRSLHAPCDGRCEVCNGRWFARRKFRRRKTFWCACWLGRWRP